MDRRSFLLLGAAAMTDSWVGWSARDGEGNTVTGRTPLRKRPRDTSYRPPSFIPADGSVEVAGALSAWLASVPDGATVDLRGTTYWSDRFVKLTGRRGLTILPGTLVRKTISTLVWPDPNPHWWFSDCHDITLGTATDGLRVLGTNTVPDQRDGFGAYKQDYEFEAAVRAEGCTNFQSHAELIDGVWGDGYQLQPLAGVPCDQFRLTGHIDRIGRQGVTPLGTNGYVSMAVDHGRRSLFDLEPATAKWPCHDITLEGCSGTAIGFPIAAGGRGQVDNITVKDCRFGDGSLIFVNASDGARRKNWSVTGTTWGKFGSPVAPARFYRVDGVTFDGNAGNIVAAQSRKSLYLEDCPVVSVRGNQFGSGLYIDNVTPPAGQQLTVSGNTPVQTVR